MDFEHSLNQLSLLSNTSTDVNNKLEFLDLIFSDEYTVSRIMSLRDGEYRQGGFALSIRKHCSSDDKVIWLTNHKKHFYFYWICSNFYIKPLNIPHEVHWILNNFKFGEKYGF